MTKLRKKNRTNRISIFFRVLIILALLIILASGFLLYDIYKKIYQPNVILEEGQATHLLIPTGAQFEDVLNILQEESLIIDRGSFEWLAEKKSYKNNINPGRYRLESGMSNNNLINLLRSGKQDPVRFTFNNIRTDEQFAGVVGRQLEIDSVRLVKLLNDKDFLQEFGYTPETVLALFIPNTYFLFWDISYREFFERMLTENRHFWNETRITKLEKTGLDKLEVSILASIIDEESNRISELPAIAGVYMNRLGKGMRLQADPTIKFALGDFSLQRILHKHLQVDSPFNTYKYAGLPPGPIGMPSISAIDAVLNYQTHDYLFFSANEDFSGYHRFAKTLREHNRNARLYHEELNRRRIFR